MIRLGPMVYLLGWLAVVLHAGTGPVAAQARDWTSTDGRKLSGVLLGIDGDKLVVRNAAGAQVVIPIPQLEEGDQSLLRNWQRDRSTESILPPVVWPAEVTAGSVKLSPAGEREKGWVMSTEHFEFLSEAELATAALQDLASVGEATCRWLSAWPLAMPEAPPGSRAVARIFKTRESYQAAGAPADTGGYYRGDWHGVGELLVPFSSLGLEATPNANTYRKSLQFSPRTLVHEMAHQQMGRVLGLLPLWLSEGLAELAALPDYRDGKFSVSRELLMVRLRQRWESYEARDPITAETLPPGQRAAGKTWTVPLATLFAINEDTAVWRQGTLADKHRIYLTSLLACTYFMHLEGDHQARRLRVYWHELMQAQQFITSRGRSGRLPEGATPDRVSIRDALLQRFLGKQSLPTLQEDMNLRLAALGVRGAF